MKLLTFLAFTLLAVNVFVAADDEKEGNEDIRCAIHIVKRGLDIVLFRPGEVKVAWRLFPLNSLVSQSDGEKVSEMLEDEMVKDEPVPEEGEEPFARFARDAGDDDDDDEEDENEEPLSDSIKNDEPQAEENDEDAAPLEPEEAFDEAEKDEAFHPE